MFRAWVGGLLLFLLGGALVTPPAQATVMIYWSDRELTERAYAHLGLKKKQKELF